MLDEKQWNLYCNVVRTNQDIEATIRDKNKIDSLLKAYPGPQDGEKIYQQLQKDGYKFESAVGMKFDDHIYEEHLSYVREQERLQREKEARIRKWMEFGYSLRRKLLEIWNGKYKARIVVAAICICLCATCFSYYGIYQRVEALNQQQYEELALLKEQSTVSLPEKKEVVVHLLSKQEVTKTILPEYTLLYEKNPELIGWIKIDDTLIDYPVMQTTDNTFYLNHDFHKQTDANGSIFLDTACNAVEQSDNMILYGHHMRSGNMFGTLNKYADQSYYEKHKYITFDTLYEKGTYEVMYVFRSKVYSEDEITFKYYQFIDASSEAEFHSAMNSMEKMSLYDTGVTASYGDRLLTLSTCDYHETKGRFVIVAKKV